jgi:hypothetical protein
VTLPDYSKERRLWGFIPPSVPGSLQPLLTVRFQIYDKSQNRWVETGDPVPIYIRDAKLLEEIQNWMKQNKEVKYAALYDPQKPVVLLYNDRDEGYIIFPSTGVVRRARGVSGMVNDFAYGVQYKSLTDAERKELANWVDIQQRKQEIEQMPPGLRELYAAMLGAGNFAVVTPALDVLARWIRREDPTRGLEEFRRQAQAASQAAPWAYWAGWGTGLGGVAGLTAEALMARGAALGASGVGRQLLAGLRTSAKPAAVGAGIGAVAGATEGALTGRDPFAEASKFGSLGLMAGLGGVTREQLISAGLLGGFVGASTARRYGVEKGVEAGTAAFSLPLIVPERLARGAFAGLTTGRRPVSRLSTEESNQVPVEWVKLRRGLSLEEAAEYASELRFDPEAQREFFRSLVEEALSKQRVGGVGAIDQLRYFREWLDPVSRPRLDQVLKEYDLIEEIKHTSPEYSLEEKSAVALRRFSKIREPEYTPSDEAAQALSHFFPTYRRRDPVYHISDEAAQALNRFFPKYRQREPVYQLSDESAVSLDQFLRMEERPELTSRPATEQQPPATKRRVRQLDRQRPVLMFRRVPAESASELERLAEPQEQRYAVKADVTQETTPQTIEATTPKSTQVQTAATTPDTMSKTTPVSTTATTTTTTETLSRTLPTYIPPWMLYLPMSVALPLLAQMGIRLPPPPNGNMPLWAYLRMLRMPGLMGRQREVYVLI